MRTHPHKYYSCNHPQLYRIGWKVKNLPYQACMEWLRNRSVHHHHHPSWIQLLMDPSSSKADRCIRNNETAIFSVSVRSYMIKLKLGMIVTYMDTITQTKLVFVCFTCLREIFYTFSESTKTLLSALCRTLLVKSFKLCTITSDFIDLDTSIPVLVSLIKFQGHSGIGRLNEKLHFLGKF